MNNPHIKEDWFLNNPEEREYLNDYWRDTELWAEVGGLGLIICTINITGANSCNAGFRIVDENNTPLPPYRTQNNNRYPVHFTSEPNQYSDENMRAVTFHMIANCQYVKLQIRPTDNLRGYNGIVRINNHGVDRTDAAWCHKAISTITAIPLMPIYQPGANTIFTYPQPRMPRAPEDDKPDIKYDKNKRKIT